MSFWCLKFSKKPTKNLTTFYPESRKWSNHKIKAHYIYWFRCKLCSNYIKYYEKVPLFCCFDHFLYTRAEICQIFRCFFLENLRLSKRHSEINWPLAHTRRHGTCGATNPDFEEALSQTTNWMIESQLCT